MHREQRDRGRRLEGQTAGEREERGGTERVEIGAPVEHRAGAGLFRSHVLDRAENLALLAHRAAGGDARDPEVGDHGAARALLEQDVVGLHVAVDDAAAVGIAEGPRDLADDACDLGGRERALPAHSLAQALAVHVRHHEVDEAGSFLDEMDGDDVGMAQSGCGARLTEKPLFRVGLRGELGRKELDGDQALERDVARQEDDPHPPASQLALEGEPSRERRLELREERVHGARECGARGARPQADAFRPPRTTLGLPPGHLATRPSRPLGV
jgi:hypothetical protein